jgi:hypothetical protein
LTVSAALVGGFTAPPVGARAPSTVRPTQALVTLLSAHAVLASPSPGTPRDRTLQAWRPITGGPTVLPVIDQATTTGGVRWLRVMLPGRPNGATGWISARGTTPSTTSWHLVVRTSRREVLVYHEGRLVRRFTVIVGKPSTPTPMGQFFVEESVRLPPESAGAPFALALSARSNVLQEFAGGPGQIALHGLANLGGTLGTAISHGCVRLGDHDITWLADRIGPGVPVTIIP